MEFIRDRKDLIITGRTGTGKSYLAMALGYRSCKDSFRVLYASTAKLMEIIEDRQDLAFDNGYLADTRKRLVRRDRREDHR